MIWDVIMTQRATALATAFLATASLLICQHATPRAEIEHKVESLPADQRIFERFRLWALTVPEGDRTRLDAALSGYSAWLKDGGFSAREIERELALLRKRGEAGTAEFWNDYLVKDRRQFLNSEPNSFLVEMVKSLKRGKALDVAMGQGRNSIWLARQGWDVTGFDPADQAIAEARTNALRLGVTIHTEITTMEQFDFGQNKWDLIVLSYAGCSEIASKVENALKPGGILIEEAFHTDALKSMKIGGSLCKPGELPAAFNGLRVLHYEEPVAKPDFAPREVRIVRFAAQKPND